MFRKRKHFKNFSILFLLLYMTQLFFPFVTSIASADPGAEPLSVTKSVSVDQIKTGQQFHYTVFYSVNDLETNFTNAILKDVLPIGVEYISVARNNQTKSINYDAGTRTVTIELVNSGIDTLLAGTTGSVQINVRIPNGSATDGAVFNNSATIEADGVVPVTSNVAHITTYGSANYWKTTKSQIIPTINPVVGSDVTYQVGLTDNDDANPYGHLNAQNVVMVDHLPVGAVFVSATGGGTYDAGTHTVTWTIGNVNIGETPTRRLVVNYPAGPFATGGTAINRVSATGVNPSGGALVIPDANVTTTFDVAKPPTAGQISFQKSRQYAYRNVGQIQTYTISNIKNPGNVPLAEFMVEDTGLPPQLEYQKVYLPQPNIENYVYTFSYKKNSSLDWTPYVVSDDQKTAGFMAATDLLNPGEWLTDIRFHFGTVPASFDAGQIRLEGTVIDPDKNGVAVLHGQVINNTAKLTYDDGTLPIKELTSTTSFSINKEKPWLKPTKTHDATKYYIPGDIVKFSVEVANKADATGPYKEPVVYDLLPVGFSYQDGTWAFVGADIPGVNPDFSATPNFNGTGRTLMKWSWEGKAYQLPVGGSFKIEYDSQIAPFTPPTVTGTREYINELYITTNEDLDAGFWWDAPDNSWANKNSIIDTKNLDGDGLKDEYLVAATRQVYLNSVASLIATKWNKGELDAAYNKFPDQGSTVPGGTADYKLEIYNDGNIWMNKIEILDILPYIGDTAVLTSQARQSQWRPNLIKELDSGNLTLNGIPVTLDVYYGKTKDKTIANFTSNKNDTNYWIKNTLSADFDITSVDTLYFDFTNIHGGTGLAPGETLVLEWKMRTPVAAPPDTGIVAWNSFGVKPTPVGGTALNPTEPIKVGFKVGTSEAGKAEIGDFIWFDSNGDGLQNDGYDGQNAGLNNVKVKLYKLDGLVYVLDDETLTANDHNGKPGYYLFPNLVPGNYYVVFEIPDMYGITVKGVDPALATDSNGNVIVVEDGKRLSKTDIINIVADEKNHTVDLGLIASAANASMSVEKKAIAIQGNDAVDPATQPVNKGERIIYETKIVNNGTVPIHNVKVQDVLDRNQTGFIFTKVGFAADGLLPVAVSPNVVGSNNTGAEPYVIIDKIEVGKTLFLQGEYTVVDGDLDSTSLDNTVKVWANEINHGGVLTPQEVIEKVDIADISITKTSDVSSVEPGVAGQNAINYTITVTNNGNVVLNNIDVTDNKLEAFTGIDADANLTLVAGPPRKVVIGTLATGAAQSITGTYTVLGSEVAKITNTATATHPNIRHTVAATKDVLTKHLSITKVATDTDKKVSVGNTITYNIKLTNTGSAPLTNVQITEDLLTSSKNGGVAQDLKASIVGAIPNPLQVGQIATVTLQYPVTTADINGASTQKIINTVRAKSDDTTPVREAVETVDIAHVKVEKTETSVGPYKVGDSLSFNIKVTNEGSLDLVNLAVTDNLYNKTAGTAFTTINTYTIAALAKGAVHNNTVTYTLTENDLTQLNSSPLKNRASVRIPLTNKTLYNEVNVLTRGISLVKTGVKNILGKILATGDKVTYTFTVKNIGNTPLSGVTLSDNKFVLPAEVRNIGDLAAGAQVSRSYEYTVTDGDLPGPIINTATVTSTEGISRSDIQRLGDAKIEVTKNVIKGHGQVEYIKANYNTVLASKEVKDYKNQPVTYVFTIKNLGDTYLNSITLTDANLGINITNLTLIPELSDANPFAAVTNLAGHPSYQKLVFYYETTLANDLTNSVTVTGNPSLSDGSDIPSGVNPSHTNTAKVMVLAELGDYVWHDADEDKVQDVGEKGLSGVTVNLLNAVGDTIMTILTDANGRYLFRDLENGIYTVNVVTGAGMAQTYDKDLTLNDSTTVTITNGVSQYDLDFGYNYTASIEGTVWFDMDTEGTKGPVGAEPRIINATIRLKDGAGNIVATKQTDASGNYLFDKLPAGNYTIEVDPLTLPAGIYPVYDLDPIRDHNTAIALAAGEHKTLVDFGYHYTGSIGDTLWYDLNNNGSQDVGETGVSGVTVKLYDQANVLRATTLTDGNGNYLFNGLVKGEYTVFIMSSPVLDGYGQTHDRDGVMDHKTTIDLAWGENIVNADFGYIPIPGVAVSKSADLPSASIGQTVKYTITIVNNGKVILHNIILADPLLGITETIPSLAIGASYTKIANYIVKSSDYPGPITNTVTVISDEMAMVTRSCAVQVYAPSDGDSPSLPLVKPPVIPVSPIIPPVAPPVEPPKLVVITTPDKPVGSTESVPKDATVTVAADPSKGTVTIDKDGKWKYTPKPGAVGNDTFKIKVTNQAGNEEEILIEVQITELALGDPGYTELPKTGEASPLIFYAIGGLMILFGLILRKRWQ